ncbi:MAG: hypothetical protein ABI140_00460 [Jatrophihabitantaceae bacterium]
MASTTELLATVTTGPILEAVLIPLTKQGKLRVTYNWLYSALNCDPNDDSDFVWVLDKLDDTHVSLSPRDPYAGRKLYTSIRDDWDWYAEVQAAHSGDWITAVGRDEILAITGADLLTISLQGFNGQYVAVDSQLSVHDWHSGFRLRSVGTNDYNARTFFMGVTRLIQPALHVPLRHELTDADIGTALASAGIMPATDTVSWLQSALT